MWYSRDAIVLLLSLLIPNLSTEQSNRSNCGDSPQIRLLEESKLQVCCERVHLNEMNLDYTDKGGKIIRNRLIESGEILFSDQTRIVFNTSIYGKIGVHCNSSDFVELPLQNPRDPLNGRVTIHYGNDSATATFECDDSFTLVDDKHRVFKRNESGYWSWNGTDPVCNVSDITQGPPTNTDPSTEPPTDPLPSLSWWKILLIFLAVGLVSYLLVRWGGAVVVLVVKICQKLRKKSSTMSEVGLRSYQELNTSNDGSASGPPPLPPSDVSDQSEPSPPPSSVSDQGGPPPIPPSGVRHRRKKTKKSDSSQPLLESGGSDSDSSRVFRADTAVEYQQTSIVRPFLNPSHLFPQHCLVVIELETHGKENKSRSPSLPVNMPSTTPTPPPVLSPCGWSQDLVSEHMHRLALRVGSTGALPKVDVIQQYMNQMGESEEVDESCDSDNEVEPRNDKLNMVAQSGGEDTIQGCTETSSKADLYAQESSKKFQERLQKLDPEMLCSYSASPSCSGTAYIEC